jgi:hypothetical protein
MLRHVPPALCFVMLILFACEGDSEEDIASDPCVRFCEAANDVEDCEHFSDCYASCTTLSASLGDFCGPAREEYYRCASTTPLLCENGHAAPGNDNCSADLVAVEDCEICAAYCRATEAAGCLADDCMSKCEQSRMFDCYWWERFLECQSHAGVACVAGGAVAIPACIGSATSLGPGCGDDGPCLVSCIAAEIAGCPLLGRDECVTACQMNVIPGCEAAYNDWRSCEADIDGGGVTCENGTPTPAPSCMPLKAAYEMCATGG